MLYYTISEYEIWYFIQTRNCFGEQTNSREGEQTNNIIYHETIIEQQPHINNNNNNNRNKNSQNFCFVYIKNSIYLTRSNAIVSHSK